MGGRSKRQNNSKGQFDFLVSVLLKKFPEYKFSGCSR